MTRDTDTTSDRDSLDRDIELLAVLKEGIKNGRPPAAIAQRIGDLGYQRVDSARDRAVIGQAYAPILELMEREFDLDTDEPFQPDFEPGEPTWRFVRDLIAAMDPAAVADERERIATAIHRAKPPHMTRDYTPVDAAYDNAARIARAESGNDEGSV